MRKLFIFIAAALLGIGSMFAQAVIDGTTYTIDTIAQRQEGPGIMFTQVRLPEFPMNAYVIEMDLNNEYNRVETTLAYNTLGKQETLANAYKRHKAEGKKPIAACNANFWVVNGHGEPWISFMLGTPFGAVVYNDTTYVNTNTDSDLWNGGPYRTANAAIDHDKRLYIGQSLWSGSVKSAKFSNPLKLVQINKRCNKGELALFSTPFTRTRTITSPDGSNFVYLNLKEGSTWAVNADMTFVVGNVKIDTNGQTLGDYDAVLVGEGSVYEPELAKLAPGDEVTICEGWATLDDNIVPAIENMVEGNAMVMKNGELTGRNYDENYNSMTYSRCAYGCDKTGKKLYMMVIDKSANEYGVSAGCSTAQMCQLWKYMCPDLWNVTNFDAGGSAQMMLNGSVINTTTEGTPRAVACGWMLYSSAPGDDKEIASIRFEQPHLRMPVLSNFSPKVLGYNKYGEIIDRDVKVTYEIDDKIGTSEGDVVIAKGDAGMGTITAKYAEGITVTAPIEVLAAQMSLRIKPTILIDAVREYPVEVVASIGSDTFKYNPARLDWSVVDGSVATLTDGVLRGVAEGETEITCALDGFTDKTGVKVEIANAPQMNVDWTGWTLKGSGKNMALSADGVLSMTYSGGRAPYISLTKDEAFYSLPDKIWLEFTSTIPMQSIQVDFRSNTMTAMNYLVFGKDEGGYEADTRYKIELPISAIGNAEDLSIYPIRLKEIRFNPRTTGYTSGENSITLHGLYGEYSHYSGVESVNVGGEKEIKVFPNPVTDGVFTVCAAGAEKAEVSVCNQAGAVVLAKTLTVNGGSATVEAALPAGIYFVKVVTDETSEVAKIIVK